MTRRWWVAALCCLGLLAAACESPEDALRGPGGGGGAGSEDQGGDGEQSDDQGQEAGGDNQGGDQGDNQGGDQDEGPGVTTGPDDGKPDDPTRPTPPAAPTSTTAPLEVTTTESVPTTPSAPPETSPPSTVGSPPPEPPSGTVFFDDFTDPNWKDRYDFFLFHRDDHVVSTTSWLGDHAPVAGGSDPDNCTGPMESRTIVRGERPAFNDQWIYRCAPGDDPAKGHLMTSIGDTSGYSVGSFSPKQTFTDITELSFDVNVTNLGGRQWLEIAIVPAANFDPENRLVCRENDCGGTTYTDVGGVGLAIDIVHGRQSFALMTPEHPSGDPWSTSDGHPPCSQYDSYCFKHGLPEGDRALSSKMERRTFTIRDNGDGTLSLLFEHADGSFETLTHPTSLPDGPVRVMFQDHNYTPNKDVTPVGHTWHWDDISVR